MTVPPHVITLRGVRAKLERADKHIDDLERLVMPLADRATKGIVREEHFKPYFELGHPRYVYRATDVPEIGTDCATIVGDALFNMRSALDHLAVQLAYRDGVVDVAPNAYFPCHGDSMTKKRK